MGIESVAAFKKRVAEVESAPGYARPAAFALGLSTLGTECDGTELGGPGKGPVLDTWFPTPNCQENFGSAAMLADLVGHKSGSASYRLDLGQLESAAGMFAPFAADAQAHPNIAALQTLTRALTRSLKAREHYPHSGNLSDAVHRVVVLTFIGDLADAPMDAHDAYLRLHLLSTRKIRPHGCNLNGIFGKLQNVVWTSHGPFAVDAFASARATLIAEGQRVQVHSVDKFPRMTDYVVPKGVRIADAERVRLGAYLGEGTTVMHEGFVNFNAGTLGTSMVEGRISAGVVVGNGSDIGGGASIMGTLSGGGETVNSLGEGCLLGANSGCGIPLGDHCVIEAGCYVTGGAKVTLPDGQVVKAKTLAGKNDLLFIRNSQSGAIEVRFKKNATALNEELHKN